jgi:sugar/nucleoside kinase (ribokinase family)
LSLVVVGSIGLDTISTPVGSVKDALGGSAIYASISASYFTSVNIIGVVGEDFPSAGIEVLKRHQVYLDGLEILPGKTFRWAGEYHSWNKADTLSTELNVFADFSPRLPQNCLSCHSLLLANIHPKLQLKVLEQTASYQYVACDTMNYWIKGCPQDLRAVIQRVQIVFMNEEEVRDYTDSPDIFSAAKKILALGPALVVVKRGEYGSVAISDKDMFFCPAYPVESVKDPTGAGDSFAGAFMANLEGQPELSSAAIRDAIRYATVMAAFNVGGFSISSLVDLSRSQIDRKKEQLCQWTR